MATSALAAKAVNELTPDEDRNIFRFMLHLLLGLPPDPTGWNSDPTAQSLLRDGITQFHGHFIDMSPADIDNLKYWEPRAHGGRGDLVGAPVLQRRRLKVLLSIYHAASRSQGKAINGMKITKAMFDHYRVNMFDPTEEITPWHLRSAKEEQALKSWEKNVKPKAKAFNDFVDENTWMRFKESFLLKLKHMSMLDLVDPNYVPTNQELHEK